MDDKSLALSGFVRAIQQELQCGHNPYFNLTPHLLSLMRQYLSWTRYDVYKSEYEHYIIRSREDVGIFRPPEPMKNETEMDQFLCGSSSIDHCSGLHEFRIRCVKPKTDVFGITSNIGICLDDHWIASQSLNADAVYGIYGSGIIMGNVKKQGILDNRVSILEESGIAKWQRNDIVSIQVNYDKWIVSFFINGLQVGNSIDLIHHTWYHPFVGSQCADAQYILFQC